MAKDLFLIWGHVRTSDYPYMCSICNVAYRDYWVEADFFENRPVHEDFSTRGDEGLFLGTGDLFKGTWEETLDPERRTMLCEEYCPRKFREYVRRTFESTAYDGDDKHLLLIFLADPPEDE